MEHLMRQTHQKYVNRAAKDRIRELCIKLSEKEARKGIRSFVLFMKYYSNMKRTVLQKYFTLWLIQQYSQSMSNINE